MNKKYWETETPTMIDTGKNILRYFSEAGKLQVSMPYWTDGAGEKKSGKTVTVDVAAVVNADDETKTQARQMFQDIISLFESEV